MHHQKRQIIDHDGNVVRFDDYTIIGTRLHAHEGTSGIHFHKELTAIGTYRYLLIDIDNDNWPGDAIAGSHLHIDLIDCQVDPDNTADFEIWMDYIKRIDASTSDFDMLWATSGNKNAGRAVEAFLRFHPVGMDLTEENFLSNMQTIGSSTYKTSSTIETVHPGYPNLAPGLNDAILVIKLNAGEIIVDMNIAYHRHFPGDPHHNG